MSIPAALQFRLAAVLLLLSAASTTKTAAAAQALSGCSDKCGDLTVPYPFGMKEGCYLGDEFFINCNHTTQPPTAYLMKGNLVVTNISLEAGELRILNYLARECYDAKGIKTMDSLRSLNLPRQLPYTVSDSKNKFYAVGCDTYAVMKGFRGDKPVTTGCGTTCDSLDSVVDNFCSGVGCCQVNIPSGLNRVSVWVNSFNNHTDVWNFNPCGYAFIAEEGQFNFNASSFKQLNDIWRIPEVINWAIGNEADPCDQAKIRKDFVCMNNSECFNRANGSAGYLCQCSPGYEGNPYHPDGCKDIDDCKASSNPCVNGDCVNLLFPQNYTCSCHKGYKKDKTNDQSCIKDESSKAVLLLKVSLGICISFSVLLVASFVLYREYKKRQFNKMKKKYFDANGGPILKRKLRQLATQQDSSLSVQIYSAEVLKTATKNYNESEKIGEGGYGIVYKGVLGDRVVAVKISKATVQKSDQYIKEVLVLSEINHRNVVKLLGCCLETKTPILVYEYISNGTLHDHIHKKEGKGEPLSFAQRLKIAFETATALSYLHHSTTTQIIHRDVKATNILLDEKLTAKVSDFGASKLVADDETQLQTLVQGTMGYLDPEYLQSHMLTDKSDVYSFGVVLVELLTGENVVRADKPEKERNLANVFVETMETKALLDPLLDPEIVRDGNPEIIARVAKLAEKCLSVKGDERPSMTEVRRELEEMLNTLETGKNKIYASSSKDYVVEVSDKVDGGSNTGAKYDASMQNQAQKPFGVGR